MKLTKPGVKIIVVTSEREGEKVRVMSKMWLKSGT